MAENEHKTERVPEKASRSMLEVPIGAKRNQLDIEKDTWYAVAELAKGKTYREIAQELSEKNGYSISYVQIWHDINDALIEWKRENMANIDAYIARDLARLEQIEAIVLQNFEKSKLPRPLEYSALMKRGFTMDEIDEMYEARDGMAGDPRYLETLLHLQAQRMKLLGLDKGADVQQNTIINYSFGNAPLDELGRLADALQDKKHDELVKR